MIGAGVAIAALFSLRLVPAGWTMVQRARERVAEQRLLLARAMDDVRQVSALEDSAATIKAKMLALAPRILAGGSRTEALADLTGRLSLAATQHHVRVARSDVVPDSGRAGSLRRVSVRFAIEGDSRGTLETLEALSRGSVVLIPADLRVVAPNPSSPAGVAELLQSEITVQGWYLSREAGQ
jgi:hypothetical protein